MAPCIRQRLCYTAFLLTSDGPKLIVEMIVMTDVRAVESAAPLHLSFFVTSYKHHNTPVQHPSKS